MTPRNLYQHSPRQRWWTNVSIVSAAVAAVIAGVFAIINQHISVDWGNIGGTVLDRPALKETPRAIVCFYHGNPPAGYRLLERQPDGNWNEMQPDGWHYAHRLVGRVTRGPWHGVIIERRETPHLEPKEYPVQTFIPDVGSINVLLYRQDAAFPWQYEATIEANTKCQRTNSTLSQ